MILRTEYPRGVWHGSQGLQRIVVGRSLRRHAVAEFSARLVLLFNSEAAAS